jgi:hypothetical protein
MLPPLVGGDIVFLVHVGSGMHATIASAQMLGAPFSQGHASSIHAALATGNGAEVIESVGGGIHRQQLSPGRYRIYRYTGANQNEMRDCAAWIAESFLATQPGQQGGVAGADPRPSYGTYNLRKAMLSPFRGARTVPLAQQFGAGAKNHSRFFCSNLIYRCYAGAAEASNMLLQVLLPGAHSQVSPRDLETLLIRSVHFQALSGGNALQHP